ncbi:acyltransferase family protein [Microbulbifer harenosus]|uniref:Acyltransferase 3 domain-containing protein n=1 Tax=Microbulbifer harenosus TaxID=2576840 RepID=A0ABY2UGV0_9GAMM|nr:acyltransferase family protein [Microbulbifer harenosus]TLM76702.1 hypothetical protein FDY93_12100 [Microbulbifer harenosus]
MERRLYHLDFLRAVMLFIGVFYRSAHADAGTGEYDFVRGISGAFRMACFFIISGYFSAMVLERRGDLSFLKGRMTMLAVPALVCVLLLAPFTTEWMLAYYTEAGTGKSFKMFWMQHAWFLLSLLVFTLPLGYILRYSRDCVRGLTAYMPLGVARLLLFVGVVAGCVFLHQFLLPKYMWDIPWIHLVGLFVLITVQHFPYFLLGVFMYLWKDLYRAFNNHPALWVGLTLACIGAALGFELGSGHLENVGRGLKYLAMTYEYVLAMVISFALFSLSARYLDKDFYIVRIMAQSAYTVYVVHFILVAFLLFILQRAGLPMDARMILSGIIACATGMLFHFAVVERFRVASLLFNGRLQPAAARRAAARTAG